MTASLLDALAAVDARMDALTDDPVGATVSGDDALLLTVGFDLDAKEVDRASLAAANGFIALVTTSRSDVIPAIRGTWLNGLLTGMMLAQLRLPDVLADMGEGVTASED